MESLPVFKVPANVNLVQSYDEVEGFKHHMNTVVSQVDNLEQKVQEVESFYSKSCKKQQTNSKSGSVLRDKDKGRLATSIQKQRDNEAAAKRMQDLMYQFGTIINQVIQRRGTRSSLESVDVKDLRLDDSFEASGKPRDFDSIKNRMEAKDGSGYKHVREIYADVRFVLKNAMKSNDEKSDAHVTAKTLLAKFEEKWLLLLPKVMQEEERREEADSFQQAYHARMAKDINNELYKVELHLKELRELVVQKCRRMSVLEKRELGNALTQLSADDLRKALEIVAQSNPAFQANSEEVDLDINAQSESTLRQLKCFVLDVRQQAQGRKPSSSIESDNNENDTNKINSDTQRLTENSSKPKNSIAKRKREICDTLHKSPPKKKTNKRGGSVV